MTNLRRLARIPVVTASLLTAVALAACGDDAPAKPVATTAPLTIEVTIGVDDDPTRVETVPVDSVVSVWITNRASADEFHVHGYEMGDGQQIPAGQTATYTFIADKTGDFEVESHTTGAVLLVLRVI